MIVQHRAEKAERQINSLVYNMRTDSLYVPHMKRIAL